jgi:kynurenine formamidase
VPALEELLRHAPRNWGRWGSEDEVGALNYLTSAEVLRGISAVRQGKVFTLQTPMGDPEGDPMSPGRRACQRFSVLDRGHFISGTGPTFPGGFESADDVLMTYLHGTTHYDALGHAWYGEQIWNGIESTATIGGMQRASILPIATRGVVGRAVVLDIARLRGKDALEPGELVTHEDLIECAAAQGCEIRKRDILLVRTGWLHWYYSGGRKEVPHDSPEPGLTYTPELVAWFHEMEIPNVVSDTTGLEVATHPESGVRWPLHIALLAYLGISLTEIAWLDDIAADSAADSQYDCLYVAGPMKVVAGTAGPVNPVAVK